MWGIVATGFLSEISDSRSQIQDLRFEISDLGLPVGDLGFLRARTGPPFPQRRAEQRLHDDVVQAAAFADLHAPGGADQSGGSRPVDGVGQGLAGRKDLLL
jgi:hypothetical protein